MRQADDLTFRNDREPEPETTMPEQTLLIDGVRVPRFLYGTAWKEEETQRLTELAIGHGFRGIDTANQRRHYHEAAVGKAIAASIAGRLGGLAGDGSPPRQRPDPPSRDQQRNPRAAPASLHASKGPAPHRSKPVLRRPELGSSCSRVLRRQWAGLPGFLSTHRQPRARRDFGGNEPLARRMHRC